MSKPNLVRPIRVSLLTNECVTAQARLDADLIPLPGVEPHLDERRVSERLDHTIVRDGLLAAWIARMSLALNQ
jgi:hypothetical protein